MSEKKYVWHRDLNRYHWFVFIVCTLAWMFDCLDQQLFNLARKPAVADLLNVAPSDPVVTEFAGWATSIMLIGWATGGILFGIMGDRIGRAKTMVWTILAYSIFTGLSGCAYTMWDFLFFRFLTGLGVGGQFSVGAALVAETLPDRARPYALGMLQALSAVGNVMAALIAMSLEGLQAVGFLDTAWRWMFLVGILPALLTVLVIRHLKEPEVWRKAVAEGSGKKKAGSVKELFGDPRWRKRTIVGMLLASAGVIGLWGIGFFSIDLNRTIVRSKSEQQARDDGKAAIDRQFVCQAIRSPGEIDKLEEDIKPQSLLSLDAGNTDPRAIYAAVLKLVEDKAEVSAESVLAVLDKATDDRPAQTAEQRQRRAEYLEGGVGSTAFAELAEQISVRQRAINGEVGKWGGITSLLFNIGAFFGIYSFSRVTQRIGRRPTFAIFFLAAYVTTVIAFLFMNSAVDICWMVPIMGFCQLSVFGGYAIYFPELFPTHLRSTGISFCYNIGRFAAASGPAVLTMLSTKVFSGYAEPMRYAGVAVCTTFLIGIVVVWFAPETRGQPLPE